MPQPERKLWERVKSPDSGVAEQWRLAYRTAVVATVLKWDYVGAPDGWFWWTGNRDGTPLNPRTVMDQWPGKGPCKSRKEATVECEREIRWQIELVLQSIPNHRPKRAKPIAHRPRSPEREPDEVFSA